MTIGEFGIIINGVKYLPLSITSLLVKDVKNKSLHDTIYCILRDIFRNCDTSNICDQVNVFNNRLMKGIQCDENPDSFEFPDALYDKVYMKNLIKWLDNFKEYHLCPFEDVEEQDKCMLDMSRYIKFDEWWSDFEYMKSLVKKHYENL